jgi:hypothetical protein
MAMINLILYGWIRRYRREKSFLLEMRLVDIICKNIISFEKRNVVM